MTKQNTLEDNRKKTVTWITSVCICNSSSVNTMFRSIVDESYMWQWRCYWCIFVSVSWATAQLSHLLSALVISAVFGMRRFLMENVTFCFKWWHINFDWLHITFQNVSHCITSFLWVSLCFRIYKLIDLCNGLKIKFIKTSDNGILNYVSITTQYRISPNSYKHHIYLKNTLNNKCLVVKPSGGCKVTSALKYNLPKNWGWK